MWFLLALFLLPSFLAATETMPWFGNAFEFEVRSGVGYSSYNKIDSLQGAVGPGSDNYQAYASLAISPLDRWSAEVELHFIDTSIRGAGIESGRLTGRYLWLDDLSGDVVSLATGVTLIGSADASTHDPSTFQVDNFEMEAHVAVGREGSNGPSWNWRVWQVLAVGYAFSDCPWLRSDTAFAVNFDDQQEARLFLRGLLGLGGDPYDSTKVFRGYGCIDHHSVDLGLRASHLFEGVGTLSVEITRRLIAENYPKQATALVIEFFYPFGI